MEFWDNYRGDDHLRILTALNIISISSGDDVLHQWLAYLVVLESGGLSDLVEAAVPGLLGAAEAGLGAGTKRQKGEHYQCTVARVNEPSNRKCLKYFKTLKHTILT